MADALIPSRPWTSDDEARWQQGWADVEAATERCHSAEATADDLRAREEAVLNFDALDAARDAALGR